MENIFLRFENLIDFVLDGSVKDFNTEQRISDEIHSEKEKVLNYINEHTIELATNAANSTFIRNIYWQTNDLWDFFDEKFDQYLAQRGPFSSVETNEVDNLTKDIIAKHVPDFSQKEDTASIIPIENLPYVPSAIVVLEECIISMVNEIEKRFPAIINDIIDKQKPYSKRKRALVDSILWDQKSIYTNVKKIILEKILPLSRIEKIKFLKEQLKGLRGLEMSFRGADMKLLEISHDVTWLKRVIDFLELELKFFEDSQEYITGNDQEIELSKAIVRQTEGKKIKKENAKNTFKDLFRTSVDYEMALQVMRQASPPIINDENEYCGGMASKSCISALIDVLRTKGKISKLPPDSMLAEILNNEFPQLKLDKTGRTLRAKGKRAYNQYYPIFNFLIK